MKRMVVIGIGSLIMMDDGIGARVAGAIKSTLVEHDIAVVIGETDVHYCLDEIQPDDILIIIDSMVQGIEPGSIRIVPLQDARNSHSKLYSQHDFSLIDALSLNYPDIQGYLLGIEAAEIGFGFELSKELQNRFDQTCHEVFSTILKVKEEAAKHA